MAQAVQVINEQGQGGKQKSHQGVGFGKPLLNGGYNYPVAGPDQDSGEKRISKGVSDYRRQVKGAHSPRRYGLTDQYKHRPGNKAHQGVLAHIKNHPARALAAQYPVTYKGAGDNHLRGLDNLIPGCGRVVSPD